MKFAGILLLTYVAGSINFAIIVLALLGKGDPRTAFSGNAGTTNVYRLAGRGWASLVLLLDVGRGIGLAVSAKALLSLDLVPWIGMALVAGNRFPCFHGFRGGKGVASYLGFTLPIAPWGAALACLAWVAVHRAVHVPFIASFCMVPILGAAAVVATGAQAVPLAGAVGTVVWIGFNHRDNILTLLDQKHGQAGR